MPTSSPPLPRGVVASLFDGLVAGAFGIALGSTGLCLSMGNSGREGVFHWAATALVILPVGYWRMRGVARSSRKDAHGGASRYGMRRALVVGLTAVAVAALGWLALAAAMLRGLI